MKYDTPRSSASDINELLSYLAMTSRQAGDRIYVYRGQTREYYAFYDPVLLTPLLPAVLRNNWDARFMNRTMPSVRKGFGTEFVKITYPYDYASKIVNWIKTGGLALPFTINLQLDTAHPAVQTILRLCGCVHTTLPIAYEDQTASSDQDTVAIDSLNSWLLDIFAQFNAAVRDENLRIPIDPSGQELNALIDYIHRQVLLELCAVWPYGGSLASFLCQQYGLKSAALDATTSLDVAAFFATRRSPAYSQCVATGIGVIYRFDVTDGSECRDIWGLDLPVIRGDELFVPLEDPDMTASEIDRMLEQFHLHVMAAEEPEEEIRKLLRMPLGSYSNSRMGRQHSVMLPAAVGKDEANRGQPGGIDGAEDLRSRPGLETFYFRHNEHESARVTLSREQLWPMQDPYMTWLLYLIRTQRRLIKSRGNGEWLTIPPRPDLIDIGYRN